MLDLTQFSSHVQAAIQALDLQDNAAKRVQVGVLWLNRNAPPDWRLQMMSIHSGKVSSNVRICRDNENPLALAFQRVEIMQRADGRVTWATVLNNGIINRGEAERCGFVEIRHYAPDNVFIDQNIDGLLLDAAWADALANYRAPSQPAVPYSEVTEKDYLLLGVARRLKLKSAA